MDITILAYLEPGDDKPDIVMEQVAASVTFRREARLSLHLFHYLASVPT